MTLGRQAISSNQAPKPVGPYSQGVLAGEVLYLSGQIPLDPATGQVLEGDVRAQAARVLANLRAVLEAANLSLASVVRTTVYVVDLADFPVVNQVYLETFVEPYPARSTVQVSALPAGARIEIDAIAVR
ncbi:MAG TPA: RidA family protein [Chloroflexota bacterium]|jgi:2-iminobutanoate/2-iminopropanoate deaminase